MTVDRWFFGMPALANIHHSSWRKTKAGGAGGIDSYLVGYQFNCDNVDGSDFMIVGQDAFPAKKPTGALDQASLVTVGVGRGTVFSHPKYCLQLEPETMIALIASPNGTTDLISGRYTIAELPGAASTIPERDIDHVLGAMKASNTYNYGGYMNITGAGPRLLEHMVVSKKIQQPATAFVVADELNVVSNSADDTSAGTGCKTIGFNYLDASLVKKTGVATMNGTAPVDIIGTYADVYIITDVWSATVGALGLNHGDILFQDDA